jgi:hypothetical protein
LAASDRLANPLHALVEVRELESYWDRINADPAALAAWLMLLLALITMVLGSGDRTTINNNIQTTTNAVIEQCVQHSEPAESNLSWSGRCPNRCPQAVESAESLEPTPGLEPGTPSLRVKCSTS